MIKGLPRSAADLLTAKGHDCIHIADALAHDAVDPAILALGSAQARVIISLDADFHTHLALSGATQPSTIRLRIEGLKAPALADLIHSVCSRCAEDIAAGAMISVDESRVRVRRLPL